jgi:enoyl-[acyl-carrier-protein] reductase (NADH)
MEPYYQTSIKKRWAKIKTNQEEMKASQEKMEVTLHSIRYEPEETIRNQVEDVLASANQHTQGLRKD